MKAVEPYCVSMQMGESYQLVPPLTVPAQTFHNPESDSIDEHASGGSCGCEWFT